MIVVEDVPADVGLRSLAKAGERVVVGSDAVGVLHAGGECVPLVIRCIHRSTLTFVRCELAVSAFASPWAHRDLDRTSRALGFPDQVVISINYDNLVLRLELYQSGG